MAAHRRLRLVGWTGGALIVAGAAMIDPWGWAAFGPAKWAAVSVLALTMVTLSTLVPGGEVNRASAIGWAVFLVWALAVGWSAVDPLYTWIGTPDRHLGFVTWLLFAGVFFAGQFLRGDEGAPVLRAAGIALILIGGHVLFELADMAPVEPATASSRAGGPLGSPAYLAAMCALLVPVAIGHAADTGDSPLWRRVSLVGAVLGTTAAVASQTRAGWVGLLAAAVLALPAIGGWLRRRRLVLGFLGLAAALVVVLSPVGSRVAGMFDFEDGAARGRIDEWQVGIAVLARHPVGGVGFEGYRAVFAEGVDADYEQRYGRAVTPDRAHNGALDVGVTTGVPGLAIYLVGVGWIGRRALLAVRRRRPRHVGIAAGVVGYVVQQQFLFPLAEVDPAFWLLTGMLVAAVPRGTSIRLRFPAGSWVVPLALASGALVAGVLDIAADHHAAAALEASGEGEHEISRSEADGAVALRPDSIRYRFVAATVAAAEGTVEGYTVALTRLEEALDLSPHDPILRAQHASARLDRARLARDAVELGAAIAEWEALVDTDPYHARYRLELGIGYRLSGNDGAAEMAWEAAAGLAPRSTLPLANLAVLYVEQGRMEEAAQAVAGIRARDPDDALLPELERRIEDPRNKP